jgi:predicted Fe-Mo cluster-binding NifX family protein
MKVCFAVEKDEGSNSIVYGHFGSAPAFVMVDTEKDSVTTIGNRDLNHEHGACNPFQAIGGQPVDAVVVGGIGAGAINGLNARGIQVYRAMAETVGQNMGLFKEGKLPVLTVQHACSGHTAGGGGCGHH